MSRSDAVTILNKAEKLIKRGWLRGAPKSELDGNVSYCLGGALLESCGFYATGVMEHDGHLAFDAVDAVLEGDSIPHFNDKIARNVKDVLKVLDKARSTI